MEVNHGGVGIAVGGDVDVEDDLGGGFGMLEE